MRRTELAVQKPNMEEVYIKNEQDCGEDFAEENVDEEGVYGYNQIFIKQEQEYFESFQPKTEDTLAYENVCNQELHEQGKEYGSSYVTEDPASSAVTQHINQEYGGTVTNESLYKFQCEYCFKRFRFFCRLKRHMASHERPKVSRVPIVDLSTLVVEENLSKGTKGRESNSDRKNSSKEGPRRRSDLICDLCGKCFTHKNNLNRHRLVHLDTKPFQCEECGQRFREKSALDRHQMVHIGGGDVFKCEECGKAFNHKGNLERHVLIHSGGRRHLCLMCGKTFTQRAHLRRHEETHTGTKELECEECGKRFNRRGNLNVHMLLHKGIKPFQCDVCCRKFSQKVNLKMHLKMQHNRLGTDG